MSPKNEVTSKSSQKEHGHGSGVKSQAPEIRAALVSARAALWVAVIGVVGGVLTAVIPILFGSDPVPGEILPAPGGADQPAPSITEETTPLEPTSPETTQPFDKLGANIELIPAGELRVDVPSDQARSAKSKPSKILQADLCMITGVGSYGGATKGCTLSSSAEGWTLVANARKSTSVCRAICFNFEIKFDEQS